MSGRAFRGPRSWPLVQLTLARLREFLREPEAIFWVFIFPLLLAIALGVAFRNRPPEPIPVGIEDGAFAELRRDALAAAETIAPQILLRPEAERSLATGKLALVVLATDLPTYRFDPTRPRQPDRPARSRPGARTCRRALRRLRAPAPRDTNAARVTSTGAGTPLGMNLMAPDVVDRLSLVQQRAGKLPQAVHRLADAALAAPGRAGARPPGLSDARSRHPPHLRRARPRRADARLLLRPRPSACWAR
ncbi:MAG: hypothetical protein R2862_04445 [Thermoanaerobaculia bacterium]